MEPASTIAGRFVLDVEIGRGGMGRVFRAHDLVTRATVAVKILSGRDKVHAARFEREGATLQELRHPAIVQYVGHGTDQHGRRYLVMEWVDGETLRSRLATRGITVREAVALGERVASALAAAHEAGFVHRDVKPQNLILPGGDPTAVKVCDFGIARWADAVEQLTATGHVVGTPSYMAPEQAVGERDLDGRTDLFALGCVLYECLTGFSPFDAPDPTAMLVKVLYQEPPRVNDVRPEIPAALGELVDRLLDKERTNRPRDARMVTDALARLAPAVADLGAPRPLSADLDEAMLGPLLAGKTRHQEAAQRSPSYPPTALDGDRVVSFIVVGDSGDATVLEKAVSAAAPPGASVRKLATGGCLIEVEEPAGSEPTGALACATALRAALPGVAVSVASRRGRTTDRALLSSVGLAAARELALAAGERRRPVQPPRVSPPPASPSPPAHPSQPGRTSRPSRPSGAEQRRSAPTADGLPTDATMAVARPAAARHGPLVAAGLTLVLGAGIATLVGLVLYSRLSGSSHPPSPVGSVGADAPVVFIEPAPEDPPPVVPVASEEPSRPDEAPAEPRVRPPRRPRETQQRRPQESSDPPGTSSVSCHRVCTPEGDACVRRAGGNGHATVACWQQHCNEWACD